MSKVIRVLIVDDSKVIQKLLVNVLSQDKRIEIIDTADNGLQAYKKILLHKPDLITLDVNMPIMNGLDLLYTMRKENIFTRVLLISTLTKTGNTLTLAALDLGAIDFIEKPSADSINSIANEIIQKVVDIGSAHISKYTPFPSGITIPPKIKTREKEKKEIIETNNTNSEIVDEIIKSLKQKELSTPKLIAIGISTGGPRALRILLPAINKNFPLPILISQHIPAEFTKSLVSSLSGMSEIDVREANDNEIIKPRCIYISPGNRHMGVHRDENNNIIIKLSTSSQRFSPSVDYMFESISNNIDGRAIAIIMTGMGTDGTDGLKKLKKNNTLVIAQDEKSSTIFGMPRSAIENNLTTITLSLDDIAIFLNRYVEGIN